MFSHHCTCGMHAVCSYESQFSTLLQLTLCVATGGVYQIIIHIPPPEPWLAMNFKRTFSLVQINHCSSLTTKRKSAYGKKRKRISGKFPLKHKKESLCFMYGCDAWSLCNLLAAIYSSPAIFSQNQYAKKGRGEQWTPWGHSWDPDSSHLWNCSTSELSVNNCYP